jgi:hypothetical protein
MHRLLVAIVRRAVWDFVLYRDADPIAKPDSYALAADAAGWIFWEGEEEVDEQGRYTFRHICEILELDVSKVRRTLVGMTRDDLRRLNNYIKER